MTFLEYNRQFNSHGSQLTQNLGKLGVCRDKSDRITCLNWAGAARHEKGSKNLAEMSYIIITGKCILCVSVNPLGITDLDNGHTSFWLFLQKPDKTLSGKRGENPWKSSSLMLATGEA